jgi:hypothetical protein
VKDKPESDEEYENSDEGAPAEEYEEIDDEILD